MNRPHGVIMWRNDRVTTLSRKARHESHHLIARRAGLRACRCDHAEAAASSDVGLIRLKSPPRRAGREARRTAGPVPRAVHHRLLVRRPVLSGPTALCGAHVLEPIVMVSAMQEIAAVVGLPLGVGGKLFNCAVLIAGGRVLGLVPKTYLPTTNEFYEERWFTPGDLMPRAVIEIAGEEIPIGNDLLFAARGFPRTGDRRRDLRRPVGREPAELRHGPGRRDGARQPLGQQRTAGQVRIPAATWCASNRRAASRPISTVGRLGRIHHRLVCGRPLADRGERRAARGDGALPTSTRR